MKNDNADLFIIYILSLFIYLNFCAFVFVFALRFGNLSS
ncbi:putative membrane protein [Escherichia coli 1827-70]|nr:putative membrane protein [Escherichia coli 1827-70]